MVRRASKNSRMMEEVSELLGEVKTTLKEYDFDVDECEADETDCFKAHGEDMFRMYQLLKELEEITREE